MAPRGFQAARRQGGPGREDPLSSAPVNRRVSVLLLVLLIACSACRRSSTKTVRVAVVPKGTTHEFWKSVHAGAVKAGRELGVEVVWKGPLKEDDLRSQIDLVQSFTGQGVSGMVLAPLNDKALVSAVRGATKNGVPVVVFDSDLASDDPVSFVATDNRAAGRLGGERLVKILGGRGKVVVLRYQEGSASTHHREEGFLDALKAQPGIQVTSSNQYGGATTESAFAASENVLSAQQAASGGVDGVFCPNESTTFGMLLALRKFGLAGKLRFVGFDASDKLLEGARQGHIDALVVQNPFGMGELGVRAMVRHLGGEKVERRIDTGAKVVDKESLALPEIQQYVHPNLTPWLGSGG
jgi:ribose transport system substrate-binding protein